MIEKKNPDYSGSAINLTNPLEVQGFLKIRHDLLSEIGRLEAAMQAYPEFEELQIKRKEVSSLETDLHGVIDRCGSYQDTSQGWYALKQRRESITYKPELVRQYAPSKVASFVLVESVDSKAMESMIKAQQITQEQARQCGEVKETFAYIIK